LYQGTTRKSIDEQEKFLATAQEEKKILPERVDASYHENCNSINRVDDELTYTIDFVVYSSLNARKQMGDWLRPHCIKDYPYKGYLMDQYLPRDKILSLFPMHCMNLLSSRLPDPSLLTQKGMKPLFTKTATGSLSNR